MIETVLATVGLALCKQPYILAAGLLLLPAWRHRRQIGAAIVATFAVSGVLALAWAHWANDHYLAPDFLPPSLGGHANYANNNVQPKDQLAYLRGHPFAFAGAVGRMITNHGGSIAHDLVAQVSYWHVPGLIAILAGCVLVVVVVVDAGRLPGGAAMRVLGLVLAAFTVLVSLFLAYVGWNAVRAPRIDGYQGRYLLVVLRDRRARAHARPPGRCRRPEHHARAGFSAPAHPGRELGRFRRPRSPRVQCRAPPLDRDRARRARVPLTDRGRVSNASSASAVTTHSASRSSTAAESEWR